MSFHDKLSRLDSAGLHRPGSPPPESSRAILLDDLRARIQATLERTARREARPPPPVDTVELPFVTTETAAGPLHVRTQRLSP
ncbi:MAG TPA: hypothetical protein VIF09_12755, partial [Polyangiaceae bacterium]